MILISHRGNLDGKNKSEENNPIYIEEALNAGYEVEIDVWYKYGEFYLGHDSPKYQVDKSFLQNDKLWCHAKNLNALNEMLKHSDIHCFWHQEDDFTLTSRGVIWTYTGKEITPKSISVLPENSDKEIGECLGVCSDYIIKYKDLK